MTATVTFIRFVLRFSAPGAVTVPRPTRSGEVDVEPDTDAHGRPHLPGTSLAGALRTWVETAADEPTADAWFGHLLEPGSGGAFADAVASSVWVLGSSLVDERGRDTGTATVVERWSTAIDRDRGAARTHTLRGEQLLAAGTRFEAFLRWDDAADVEVNHLLALLTAWQPVIGRGTSRGSGRCEVEALHYGTLHLDRADDLLQWLTTSGPHLVRAVANERPQLDTVPAVSDPRANTVVVPLTIVGPLHVGAGGDRRVRSDPATGRKVTALHSENGTVVITGGTWKGIFRSRVEYILGSVGADPKPCTDARCARCWPCLVFGHGGGTDVNSDSVGLRGRVRFLDSAVTDSHTRERTHVAIDRFTGGARDEWLYTIDGIEAGQLELVVENGELRGRRLEEFLALVRLVLADLDDGLIGVGAATARGYGSVRADTSAAEKRGLLPDVATARRTLSAMVRQPRGAHA